MSTSSVADAFVAEAKKALVELFGEAMQIALNANLG